MVAVASPAKRDSCRTASEARRQDNSIRGLFSFIRMGCGEFFCFSVGSCRMGAKVLVNWLNTKLVLILEDMRKLADACPTNDDT
ncbi:hypothetical protein WN944_005675 [Citrus x changshan-huyou]|uniref:Uncharacterized protein n=1 Tax=Citrus x changshan-huyou TaxID=2935761 RepID=A0AAP0QSS9_9ROSI